MNGVQFVKEITKPEVSSHALPVVDENGNELGIRFDEANMRYVVDAKEAEKNLGERVEDFLVQGLSKHGFGESECVIICKMLSKPMNSKDYPLDYSDFTRCMDVLELMPEWEANITRMADVSKQWKYICDNFHKLKTLYLLGDKAGVEKLLSI